MTSSMVSVLTRRRHPAPLALSDAWPDGNLVLPPDDGRFLRYAVTPASIHHRFAEHPFRRYSFGAWREGDEIRGLVVFRPVHLRGLRVASRCWRPTATTCRRSWRDGPAQSDQRASISSTSRRRPASPFRDALRATGIRLTVPIQP